MGKSSGFAELRVTRHSGTSCLVAGEADVDVTTAPGRANCAVGLPNAHTNVFSKAGSVRECYRHVHGANVFSKAGSVRECYRHVHGARTYAG